MGTVRLQERIAELARQRATAVSLRDLWKHGHKPSPSVRLQNAIFLQHELPIRMAQRIEELRNLPFGLGHDSKPILQVIDWYSSFVDTLTAMPRPRDQDDERRFTATIEAQLQTPSVVEMMLSSAVRCQSSGETLDEPLRSRPGATRTQQRKYMQSVLDRFFTARIGLRFLMEHHIQSGKEQEDGWAGVIQANFDPTHVLQHAADDARHRHERAARRQGGEPARPVHGEGAAAAAQGRRQRVGLPPLRPAPPDAVPLQPLQPHQLPQLPLPALPRPPPPPPLRPPPRPSLRLQPTPPPTPPPTRPPHPPPRPPPRPSPSPSPSPLPRLPPCLPLCHR